MSERIEDLKEEEKEGTGVTRSNQGWIAGLILIGLGLIFLANNFFNVTLIDNWWALFILIPAVSNLNRAWNLYREAGHWTGSARSALVGGLLITTVALFFLFNVDWGNFWPLLLIILGISILFRGH